LNLRQDETQLVGNWKSEGGVVSADAIALRIQQLCTKFLVKIAEDPASSGWITLFRDPADGRLWERTYPQSDMHGGGPPSLICISEAEALARYGVAFQGVKGASQ